MQRLEVSGAVRPIYGSLGVKRLTHKQYIEQHNENRIYRTEQTQQSEYINITIKIHNLQN